MIPTKHQQAKGVDVSVRTLALVTLAIVLVCATGKAQDSETPKFEAGVQFTLLTVNQPTPAVNCCVIVPSDYSNSYWKSGIGGRLTYNFNEFLAAEATVNYFPDSRRDPTFFIALPEGKIYQGQFGVKAGKRSDRSAFLPKHGPVSWDSLRSINWWIRLSLPF